MAGQGSQVAWPFRTGAEVSAPLSSLHALTLSSKSKLSPEPLRLTRPSRVRFTYAAPRPSLARLRR